MSAPIVNKYLGRFRGTVMKLEGSYDISASPDGLSVDHNLYAIDRWMPVNRDSKEKMKSLPERHLGWIQIPHVEEIYWGTERNADFNNQEYIEYYAIIVLRPKHIDARKCLETI